MNSDTIYPKLHLGNKQEPINVQLTDRLSARLYEDCCPHCMETSALQKGLILMLDGKELIEEGLGFAAPVVRYRDKTYFSSSAETSVQKSSLGFRVSKRYVLDAISRKKFLPQGTYIDDNLYSLVRKTFAKLYLAQKNMSPFFNTLMEAREAAKIKTEFIKVQPRGTVNVTYEIQPTKIGVSVDCSDLTLDNCNEVLLLNEQGSTVFEKYVDANGLRLSGREIGAWAAVTAESASMVNVEGRLSFSLHKIQGSTLFRGWERTRNRFSWAGLSYSLRPNRGIYSYLIKIDIADN